MPDDINETIYRNLNQKETEELLNILQSDSPEEWDVETFSIIERILHEREVVIPDISISRKIEQLIKKGEAALEQEKWEQALQIGAAILDLDPKNVDAITMRGQSLYEAGDLEKAIADFQTAIRLDPDTQDAWDDLQIVEQDITELYLGSDFRLRLDRAAELALDGEFERATAEIECLKKDLPSCCAAHNYLGQIAEEIGRLDMAVEEYFIATQLDPGCSEAWRNLRKVHRKLEGEKYGKVPSACDGIDVSEAENDMENVVTTDSPLPGWHYLDATAFYLIGWPGYRFQDGRSGLDPLANDFEQAHMEGVIIRRLLTGTFRTHNPFYLLLMTFIGVVYCLPLLGFTLLADRYWIYSLPAFVYIPYSVIGAAILMNVINSIALIEVEEDDETGGAFY